MQRPNITDSAVSGGAPLASVGPSAYLPGYPPGMPPGTVLPPATGSRTWPTLNELLNALKRRAVLALFLGLLIGVACGAGIWLAMPSGKHEVRAKIQMKPNIPVVGQAEQINAGDFEAFKQTQMVLMKITPLLVRVTKDPAISKLQMIMEDDDPVRTLEERIRFRWESPEILAVYMSGDDPIPLQQIINKHLELYLIDAEADSTKQLTSRRLALERTRDELNKQIQEAADQAKRILTLTGSPTDPAAIAQQQNFLLTSLDRLNAEVSRLKQMQLGLDIRLTTASSRLKQIDDTPVDQAELELQISKGASNNLEIQNKLKERAAERAALEKMRLSVNEDAPVFKQKLETIQRIDAEIRQLTDLERPKLESGIKALLKREWHNKIEEATMEKALIDGLLQATEKEVAAKSEQLDRLRQGAVKSLTARNPEHLQAQLAIIEKELAGLVGADKAAKRITGLEDAKIILNQNLRQKILLAFGATLAGAAVVMLGIAFLEWRSRRIDSLEQVVNDLGLRVIGTIPAFPSKNSLRSGDAATSQNWRFVLNESVNSARTMLLHTAKTQNMQVLMVTSAMQGEGKTSLSSQLATSMATAGLRTLILDFDLRNPSIHKLFDAQLTPGSAEILCQEVDISDAVQPTTVPNLWLIPAGQCSNRVIAALAQGHPLDAMFNRLRGQFDFIVVDCCPILPVADALLVGQHVDGVVLSVLQDISQLPKVQTAIEKLIALNIPLLGAIVNGVKPDIQAYGYNYVKQLPA